MKEFWMVLFLSLTRVFALGTGEAMPELQTKMKNIDERLVSLSELRGKKGTLVVFTSNACPYAKRYWNRMSAIGSEFQTKGFGVVAINSNDPKENEEDSLEEMKKRAQDLKFPYVVDATSQVAKSFGASKTPEVYLFDAKDRLVYQGAIDSDPQDEKNAKPFLRDALNAVLGGKKIQVSERRAIGCSIRFRSAK
jgi:peroxiredoxin